MPLPSIDPVTRVLPSTSDKSPHPATLDEVYEAFVVAAPHRQVRERIFAALRLYSDRLWEFFPGAPLWINGGFVTHKESPPHDVDLAFLTTTQEIERVFSAPSDAITLLTLQSVSMKHPFEGNVPRVQPFGGLVDGFFVPTDIPEVVQTWRDRWSVAPNPDGNGYRDDMFKGFVEVTP